MDPFDQLLQEYRQSGEEQFSLNSVLWWRQKVRELYGSESRPRPPYKTPIQWIKILKERYGPVGRKSISGKMYIFRYDPTTKQDLKYWDALPLVMSLERTKDGFMGVNLHYLNRKRRGLLLTLLASNLKNATEDDIDEGFLGEPNLRSIRTRFRTYNKIASKQRLHKIVYPAIRRYKTTGLLSPLVEIPITDWELAAYLPSDYFFVGENRTAIQRDSINKRKKKFG
tara:strand:- start:241 stop:918 length:678 start_codon:yes stop_codon:yes gene_type:complete